jgi:hypothetical protein
MNEIRFTSTVRRALDESTQRLPWRVTQRLEQARKTALLGVPEAAAEARRPAERFAVGGLLVGVSGPHSVSLGLDRSFSSTAVSGIDFEPSGRSRPPFVWRLAAILAPAALLVAALIAFSELESARDADEVADLEAAVLADEVPIAAYADRGFGVFLKNSYQPEQ